MAQDQRSPSEQLLQLLRQATGQVEKAELDGFELGYASALEIAAIQLELIGDKDAEQYDNVQTWAKAQNKRNRQYPKW